MTMITPSYLGETIEYSSLHACRSTLEDPTAYRLIARLSCGTELGAHDTASVTFVLNAVVAGQMSTSREAPFFLQLVESRFA